MSSYWVGGCEMEEDLWLVSLGMDSSSALRFVPCFGTLLSRRIEGPSTMIFAYFLTQPGMLLGESRHTQGCGPAG